MVKELTVKVFSDGANLDNMLNDLNSGIVTGFTTNPSLMKKLVLQVILDLLRKS